MTPCREIVVDIIKGKKTNKKDMERICRELNEKAWIEKRDQDQAR
jgi:hypothetical protein